MTIFINVGLGTGDRKLGKKRPVVLTGAMHILENETRGCLELESKTILGILHPSMTVQRLAVHTAWILLLLFQEASTGVKFGGGKGKCSLEICSLEN